MAGGGVAGGYRLGWMHLFFWYFSGVTHLLIQLGDGAGFSGFRQAILMSTLWQAPLLMFAQCVRSIAAVLGTAEPD